ncbi:Metal-dependent hydrolase, endonuclease/exonuclease/phosphatase family [Mucilaginibacter sp. OK268]|uniref:FG-GAP-like repeat-containing protein n=1 Tax=Mucilaginibacter sp. OK268 TaxID=1881048 RepID=UPI00088DAC08|nr:FG-GAP-like repeat-containing protein [Mucilaginibacter sp. OK268]SDP94676.1 Metal-dependent hydrolase, endonuclease/exonuclease/phosphatase family [Mucilaginibacter sp. OK268]
MKNNNTNFIKATACLLGSLLCFSSCQKSQLGDSKTVNNSKPPTVNELSASATSPEIRVLSFNVRHNDPSDAQSITERQGNIRQIIVDNNPDIFGLQEFSDNSFENWFIPQMATLGYGVYFDESAGMGTPKVIFYKTNRFTLQSSGTIVLGPTNTGTWAKLLDNSTGLRYFVSNSHWQFDSQPVRLQNSQALVAAVKQYNTEGLPEIVFGDFNAKPGTEEINNLKDGLDLVDALGDTDGDLTFHGWTPTGTGKIDWIMSDRSMSFTSWKVITTSYNGFWPSDHWPVMANFVPGIFGGALADANGKSANANTKFYFADINGDGKADKVYWNATYDSGRPQIFLSNGDGTFVATAVVHTAGASTSTTTRYYYADVNGDGKADEILWDPTLNSGHTRVYLATTNGNFSATVIDNPEGTSAGTTTIYNFADVNGDGKADKIYWNGTFDSGHTRVYLATSNGNFSGTVVSGTEGASTTGGSAFYYADVNGDGKADKILWQPTLNSGKPSVFLSDGDGTFTASTSFTDAGASSVSAATVFYFTDVNGDGRADKIYWNPGNYLGKLKIYYATTANTFDGPYYSLRGTSQSGDTDFFFADINGDGKNDQIRWNYAENSGELRNYFAK